MMATIPVPDMTSPVPAKAPRRGWWIALLSVGGVAGLIYSGVAWSWLKPIFQKNLINRYAVQYQMDPLWVMAVIKAESGFSPWAHSPRGAIGLMQLLPSTAQDIAPEVGLGSLTLEQLRKPENNVRLGVHYLAKLERRFPDDPVAVLSAYNAGPGVTQQWRKGKPVLDIGDIPYPETRRFVRRVQDNYATLKRIQRFRHLLGFDYER